MDSRPGSENADTFGRQWERHDYDRDRTWGATLKQREEMLLADFGHDREWFSGKTFLDAGCGNGTVSAAAQRLGCVVTAVDISDSIDRARARFPGIDFRRADLTGPLGLGMFDLVYSGGVLHHTPDTRSALRNVARHVNPGGLFYVWLYGKVPGRAYELKSRLRRMGLPYRARSAIATAFAVQGRLRHPTLTLREHRTAQHDFFTPTYRWEHTPAEVSTWFVELEFSCEIRSEARDGFGVLAERQT